MLGMSYRRSVLGPGTQHKALEQATELRKTFVIARILDATHVFHHTGILNIKVLNQPLFLFFLFQTGIRKKLKPHCIKKAIWSSDG